MLHIQADTHRRSSRNAIAALLAMPVATSAFAAPVQIDLPAQPLSSALREFGPQSGIQVAFQSALTDGKAAPALNGRYEPGEALDTLLQGSGLTAYPVNGKTYGIRAVSVSAAAATAPAVQVAQSTARPASPAAPAVADRAAEDISLEEVVVTGSRVIANGNESPTPVTVLSADELLQANPGNIATAMTMLPSIIGSPNQGGQSQTNFQAVLNLRGMGGARNLVLFDGHRVQATTVQGGIHTGVDSNLIPTMLLKRVDVVTGGASAVYGSDAVSGVINYVVDNNFNGVKINAQGGISEYGDDRTYNIGLAAGTPLFDGRGHIEFSAQRIYDPGLPDRWSRQWGREVWSMQGSVVGSTAAAGSAANPYVLVKNSRFNLTNFGGVINTGPLAGLQFANNGVLSTFNRGTPTGSATIDIGGDGTYFNTYPAFGEQTQNLGLARFDYSFTDTTKFYVEIVAGTSLNENPLANAEVRTRAVGYNNAYLASVQQPYQGIIATQLAANPLGSFNYSRIFTADQFNAPLVEARGRQWLYLTGLEGEWGDYKWNLGYEYADSGITTTNPNNVSNARLFAAMNAVVNPANGQIVCNAALVNPAVYGNCVPLNVFGPSASSRAAYEYVRQYTQFKVNYLMDDVTASIAGSPFNSWAGPIDMALSGEWRRQSYEIKSNAQSTDRVNCTGIQFNCNASTAPYFAAVTNNFPKSSVTVKEAALEAQVPLLKERFLAESLSLNGAARYTNYSTSGGVWTWKLGLTWSPIDSLNFRAARSRDIRAPNQNNLFAPLSCSSNTFTDIHTNNTTGTVPSCVTGNPDLKPEEADTWTLGVVWTPNFMPGLSVSLDAYRIDLTDALNTTSGTQPATQAACEASGGTSPVCAVYIRPFPFSNRTPANFPTQVLNVTQNTGGVFTQGIDTEINYARSIAGRRFSTRLLVNWQPDLTYDLGASGLYYLGGAADGIAGLMQTPDVKAMLQISYEMLPNFTATLQERYRNALKQHGSPLLYFAIGKQPPTFLTDLNFNYKFMPGKGDMELFLNIRNLFNTAPDPWAASGANAQIGSLGGYLVGDDIIGRFYTLGVRYKL